MMRLFSPRTLSARLTAFSLVFIVLAMAFASVILWFIVAGVVREQIDQRLDVQIEGLRHAITINPDGQIAVQDALDGPPFDRPGSGWYWNVEGPANSVSSHSMAQANLAPPPPDDWRQLFGEPRVRDDVMLEGRRLHLRSERAMIDGHPVDITVSAPQSALSDPARRALLLLLAAMSVLGITLIGGIGLQVRFGLKPLKALTGDIAAISAGERAALPLAETQDLQPISDEINRLVDQNARRLKDTRLHFANLAHSLKTPAASLSLALTPQNDPDGEMRRLVERIDQRIRHHLADARRTMAGAPPGAASVLKAHVDDILLIMARLYAAKSVTLSCSIEENLSVACSGEDLDEILGNLIDNAFKWADSHIVLSARQERGFIVVNIRDDGPGITQQNIADALLPGVRLDETVSGDGFGLTITKELVELYGGGIRLENREEGGLEIEVSLPLALASAG